MAVLLKHWSGCQKSLVHCFAHLVLRSERRGLRGWVVLAVVAAVRVPVPPPGHGRVEAGVARADVPLPAVRPRVGVPVRVEAVDVAPEVGLVRARKSLAGT